MKRILVFLGDHFLRDNIGEVLRFEGYNVIPAIGIKSMNVIKTVKPDLILSDIKVAWVDSMEVLTSLRSDESTSNVKFIFIDNKVNSADRASLTEKGADAFLTIPFSLTDMLRTVSALLTS